MILNKGADLCSEEGGDKINLIQNIKGWSELRIPIIEKGYCEGYFFIYVTRRLMMLEDTDCCIKRGELINILLYSKRGVDTREMGSLHILFEAFILRPI